MNSIAAPTNPMELGAYVRSGYPEPFRTQVLPREKRALGDAAGLTKIGINHTARARCRFFDAPLAYA